MEKVLMDKFLQKMNNYPRVPQRSVFKVDVRTGNIIERFDSCILAAIPIFLSGKN